MSRELLIDQFNKLIANTNGPTSKERFKINNYKRVVSSLKETDYIINTTEDVLVLLRASGMKLTNEKPPNYKSSTLLKIQEILTNGNLKELQLLEEEPKTKSIAELITLPDIGPSHANRLYELGITSIADLKLHLQDNPELLNRKQLIGLRNYRDLQKRIPREEMDKWSKLLITLSNMVFNKLKPKISIIHMELSGSYRRGQDTSGDVDFYIAVDNPRPEIMDELLKLLVKLKVINSNDIICQGAKKTMAVARLNPSSLARHLDIFIFSKQQYPFALMFATGSGEFNIKFRKHALTKGWSLCEKDLRKKPLIKGGPKGDIPDQHTLMTKIGKTTIETELDIFTFLDVGYIEPNARTPTVSLTILS